MSIYKLTKEDRANMDVIGWAAILAYSERDTSYKFFNSLNFSASDMGLQYNENLEFFKVLSDDVEVGRFGVVKNETGHCLSGLFIYPPYRNKGFFKKILDYIVTEYDCIYLYTSNHYMASSLFKDKRFKSEGWNPRMHTDDLEVRFVTVNKKIK